MYTKKDLLELDDEYLIFHAYCKLFNLNYASDDLEESLTKEKMINDIYDFYLNDKSHFIINSLNEFDIDALYKMTINDYIPNTYNPQGIMYLLICDIVSNQIVEEIKDIIIEELEYYFENQEEIKEKKEKAYIIVGLIRTYGVLTYNELKQLFNLYYDNINIDDYINHPYVTINTYSHNDIYYDSIVLIPYRETIFNSHNNLLDYTYDYKYLNNRGRYYFDTESKEYHEVIKDIGLYQFIDIYKELISLYRGFDNPIEDLFTHIELDLDNNKYVNKENRGILEYFYDSLPSYLLDSNKDLLN